MAYITLKSPVVTIYGDLLVDRGVQISPDNIDSLIPRSTPHFPDVHFLSYRQIKKDLLDSVRHEPYRTIFNDRGLAAILELIERFSLPAPVIETIYYFRAFDWYTYRHFLMVLALTTLLSREMIEDPNERLKNIKAGTAHDIGKFCIPESILKKKTALTRREKEDLKEHTLSGSILLQYYFGHNEPNIALAARNHHERKDGSGYPFQTRQNDDIADIIVVSDIFDALISSRPYRGTPYTTRSALDEITAMALQEKISMDVVRALVQFNREEPGHYSRCDLSMDMRGVPPADNLYDKTED